MWIETDCSAAKQGRACGSPKSECGSKAGGLSGYRLLGYRMTLPKAVRSCLVTDLNLTVRLILTSRPQRGNIVTESQLFREP